MLANWNVNTWRGSTLEASLYIPLFPRLHREDSQPGYSFHQQQLPLLFPKEPTSIHNTDVELFHSKAAKRVTMNEHSFPSRSTRVCVCVGIFPEPRIFPRIFLSICSGKLIPIRSQTERDTVIDRSVFRRHNLTSCSEMVCSLGMRMCVYQMIYISGEISHSFPSSGAPVWVIRFAWAVYLWHGEEGKKLRQLFRKKKSQIISERHTPR